MFDTEPININRFNGTFDRGNDEVCPNDHALDSLNVKFDLGNVKTRHGSGLLLNIPNVLRMHSYKRIGEAPRLLILVAGGALYDSLNLVTPLITIPAATDFSTVTMFNRAYIAFHNGQRGLPGVFLYVYDGTTIRQAGGSKPSGFTIVAATGSAGKIEAGQRLFAVAFETNSGFITPPGPSAFTLYTGPGGFKVNLSGIPIGGASISFIWILATKAITGAYSGNQNGYEFFFVDRVANGVTTYIADFFDADLSASADYLYDQVENIPSPLGLLNYNGNLVTWGEDASDSIIRVSKSGFPENFSSIDGFAAINPGDGGGVKACVDYNGLLKVYKSQRGYNTRNNGLAASSWTVEADDAAIGTEVFGISKVFDSTGNTRNMFLIADREGLIRFGGSYADQELTWKIKDIWDSINKIYFHKIQVVMDPIGQRIFVNVPLGSATEISHMLYADYSEGLDAENIKWSIWTYPIVPKTIFVDVDFVSKNAMFEYGGTTGIYKEDYISKFDFSNAIDSYYELAKLTKSTIGEIMQFNGVRLNIKGAGSLKITLSGLNNTKTAGSFDTAMQAIPGAFVQRAFAAGFSSEKASIKFRTNLANEWFELTQAAVYADISWRSRAH